MKWILLHESVGGHIDCKPMAKFKSVFLQLLFSKIKTLKLRPKNTIIEDKTLMYSSGTWILKMGDRKQINIF